MHIACLQVLHFVGSSTRKAMKKRFLEHVPVAKALSWAGATGWPFLCRNSHTCLQNHPTATPKCQKPDYTFCRSHIIQKSGNDTHDNTFRASEGVGLDVRAFESRYFVAMFIKIKIVYTKSEKIPPRSHVSTAYKPHKTSPSQARPSQTRQPKITNLQQQP